jgi:hypothetical protein
VAVPNNVRYVMGLETPPVRATAASEAQRDFSQQFGFSLDFWWLYLFYLGAMPAWAALCAAGALMLGAGVSARVFAEASAAPE